MVAKEIESVFGFRTENPISSFRLASLDGSQKDDRDYFYYCSWS